MIDLKDIAKVRELINNYITSDSKFIEFCEKATEGFAYYDNKDTLILKNGAAAMTDVNGMLKSAGHDPLHAADNKIPLNRHRVVVDQKIGYLYATPPQIDLDNDMQSKEINKVISDSWGKVIRQLGNDASNAGRGWLAYWYDENKKFEYWYLNPKTVRPVYDYSKPKKKLIYIIRCYQVMLEDGKPGTRFEIWDDKEVAYCVKPNTGTPIINFEQVDGIDHIEPHPYGRIPFIEFANNAICSSDLEMYKPIIDADDKLVSGFANDLDDIQEILWVIKNYDGNEAIPVLDENGNQVYDDDGKPQMKSIDIPLLMKLKKYVTVTETGGVEALHNEIPFEARAKFREILNDEFWIAAMAVNPNPSSLGNQSGVYLEYLYGLLEHKAALQETEFRPAINDFIHAVMKFLSLPDVEITQVWKRTKPQNIPEIVNALDSTANTVMSDESKTKVHPLINDWQAERKQIEKEQTERDAKQKEMFGGDETKEEVDDDKGNNNPSNIPNKEDKKSSKEAV